LRASLQPFEFIKRFRPIFAQQSGQGTVGEKFAPGLAGGAVIGLIGRIADALNLSAAARTRLLVLAMYGHLRAESGYFFWKFCPRILLQDFSPTGEFCFRSVEQVFNLFRPEFLRQLDGREPRLKKDLIRVSVADPA
jgi:hypothetical protein